MELEVRTKRERKANFSEDEILTLLEEILTERAIILGKYSATLTMAKKAEVWDRICFKLNAMFGNNRRSHELKKKWKDLKSSVKHKNLCKSESSLRIKKETVFNRYILDILASQPITINGNEEPETTQVNSAGSYSPPYLEMLVSTVEEEKEKELPVKLNVTEKAVTVDVSEVPVVSGIQNENNSLSYSEDFKMKKKQERELLWKMDSLQAEKLELKIKWLKSEIEKNDSIVELNQAKADYIRAKKAKLWR